LELALVGEELQGDYIAASPESVGRAQWRTISIDLRCHNPCTWQSVSLAIAIPSRLQALYGMRYGYTVLYSVTV